jgi:hypothetical protein
MLKQRASIQKLNFDSYIFSLCKQRVAQYYEALDSLNKAFEIYTVEFSNNASGKLVSDLFNNKNNYQGFLMRLDSTRNGGPEIAFLLEKFTLPLSHINYRVTHQTTGYYLDENTVEISSATPRHGR